MDVSRPVLMTLILHFLLEKEYTYLDLNNGNICKVANFPIPRLSALFLLPTKSLINNRMVTERLERGASEGESNGWGQSGRSLGVRQHP